MNDFSYFFFLLKALPIIGWGVLLAFFSDGWCCKLILWCFALMKSISCRSRTPPALSDLLCCGCYCCCYEEEEDTGYCTCCSWLFCSCCIIAIICCC